MDPVSIMANETLIIVSLSLLGFKSLSSQVFYSQGHCDLDLLPTDPKNQ